LTIVVDRKSDDAVPKAVKREKDQMILVQFLYAVYAIYMSYVVSYISRSPFPWPKIWKKISNLRINLYKLVMKISEEDQCLKCLDN